MATDTLTSPAPRARRLADNGTLGMALFVFTEVMLFTGVLSAFAIVKAAVGPGMWPPADQPRLPIERTALNTAALLASGITLFLAGPRMRARGAAAGLPLLGGTLALGALFVALQGAEWLALLRHGLTLRSSQLGSFFYVIVGAHALHAIVAIAALALVFGAAARDRLKQSRLGAVTLFWYFVVLLWPVLYTVVYL